MKKSQISFLKIHIKERVLSMPKSVILGITAFNHDASAALICDGKVIAFAEEERFNGVKHSGAFPLALSNIAFQRLI